MIRRSLFLHASAPRAPHAVLSKMLDHVTADTPPDGPDGPVAVLERRVADLLGHAVAIAAAVNADGAARVWPDPPQTPLFHVHVPVGKDALERAHADLMTETGVQVFGYARSAPDPGRCCFEISVGEHATGFGPDEVVGLIHQLLKRAR